MHIITEQIFNTMDMGSASTLEIWTNSLHCQVFINLKDLVLFTKNANTVKLMVKIILVRIKGICNAAGNTKSVTFNIVTCTFNVYITHQYII